MDSRPPIWPNGARCAVCIAFDCDGETLLHTLYPDTHHEYVAPTSFVQYEEVALPRIGQVFDDFGINQTFFVPAWCLQQYPEVFAGLVESGHELAHHGYLHESPSHQTDAGERYWFEKGVSALEAFTGKKPAGYRAPWLHGSPRTLELVAEHGLLYDSSLLNDHNPYVLSTPAGEIIEIPTDSSTIEDFSQYGQTPALGFAVSPRSPQAAHEVWLAEFEAAYDEGSIFVTTFHPMLSGRPARLRAIRDMLETMAAKGDVWFATLEEIAQHVRAAATADPEAIRRVDWPLSAPGRIPEFMPGYVEPELALRKTTFDEPDRDTDPPPGSAAHATATDWSTSA